MISVHIPFFPPSTNHAYLSTSHGRILTKEGKRYKTEVQHFLGQHCPGFIAFFKPNIEYEILFMLYFEAGSLYTKSWPKNTEVSRHKRIDATNRVKLLEDVITETAGYNDCQHFAFSVVKTEASVNQHPFTDVYAWDEQEDGPLARYRHTRIG